MLVKRAPLYTVALCLCVVGLPFGASGQSPPSYPAKVHDFAQWDKFPAQCAGYRRGEVTAYAPALADYSVGYDLHEGTQHSAVTLFFYPRLGDQAAQLRDEEAEVLEANPRGHVVSRRTVALERDGKSYKATVVTFEFNSRPPAKPELLSSQLWVVFSKSQTFKVRSTGPIGRAVQSEAEVRQILQCVAWSG